jgi:hypothetical protein
MAPSKSAYTHPPEPQLLDTCTIQNLNWVDRTLAEAGGTIKWNRRRLECLAERYGPKQAKDLVDLGTLYVEFECRGAYPWLVSRVSVEECGVLHGEKGDEIRGMLRHLAGHQEDLSPASYPSVAVGGYRCLHGPGRRRTSCGRWGSRRRRSLLRRLVLSVFFVIAVIDCWWSTRCSRISRQS